MENRITGSLIIMNTLVFLLVFSMPEALLGQTFAAFSFSWPHALEAWRWLTSLFLHANASHLFFNMLALYFFGRVLEGEVSGKQFLAVYFLAGLAGNLVYGLTSIQPAVGASGCIFGVIGASMLLKPKELIRIYVFPLPLGIIAILYMLSQAAIAAMPGDMSIAYMAHVGGFAAGSALTFFYRPKESAKGLVITIVLFGILVVLAPLIGILMVIGELILGVLDFVIGILLYGAAKLMFGWIWALL